MLGTKAYNEGIVEGSIDLNGLVSIIECVAHMHHAEDQLAFLDVLRAKGFLLNNLLNGFGCFLSFRGALRRNN